MPGSTARLALPTISGSEDIIGTYTSSFNAEVGTLDNAMLYLPPGPLEDLPAAGDVPAGSVYYADDVGILLHAVGIGASATTWIQTLFSPGDVKCSAISSPPSGWLTANGSTYDPEEYPFLYAAIGTTFGGSPSAPLLPDLRGRAPIGVGTGNASAASAWTLGQTPTSGRGGEETHALLLAELAAHAHTINSAATGVTVETGDADIETGYANLSGSYFSLGEMSVANAVAPGFYWGAVNGEGIENYAAGTTSNGFNVFGYTNEAGYEFDFLWDNGHSHSIPYSYDFVDSGHSHGDRGHGHGISDPHHTHTENSVGSGTAHNNMAPVIVVNWFVKT